MMKLSLRTDNLELRESWKMSEDERERFLGQNVKERLEVLQVEHSYTGIALSSVRIEFIYLRWYLHR